MIFFLFCEQELTVGSLGQVMLDTVGPELQVVNKNETPVRRLSWSLSVRRPVSLPSAAAGMGPLRLLSARSTRTSRGSRATASGMAPEMSLRER